MSQNGSQPTAGVVFMVVSGEQLRAAHAVGVHLPSPATVINPYTGLAAPLDGVADVQRPHQFRLTPAAIMAARRTVRRGLAMSAASGSVLVIGQDEGFIERVAVAAARRAGAAVVLMPDGVGRPQGVEGTQRSWARDGAHRALAACGIVSGRRGQYGSSDPDLILSWGPGWETAVRGRSPHARILVCGSPTSDALAEIAAPPGEGHLLICSQTLIGPPPVPPDSASAAWYAWLIDMARADHPHARIRLHPGEVSPLYPLPAELAALRDRPRRPLVEDLAWADVVLSPYSSTLVEAVGAGRVAMSAAPPAYWGAVAQNAFLQDARLPSADFRDAPPAEELLRRAAAAAHDVRGLRETYLSNVGTASERAASAIAAASASPA